MAAILERLTGFLWVVRQICRQILDCIRMSPCTFVLATLTVLGIVSLLLVYNICMAKVFTFPGSIALNLILVWLLLRLIVRALVFPGSIVLWKRNTEASYRVEMAKQFAHHIEQLQHFLKVVTGRPPATSAMGNVEGTMWGCKVIEGLARNFRAQQRDQVHFTAEQANFKLLVQGVESWLGEAKVLDRRGRPDATVPLLDWLQREAQTLAPMPFHFVVAQSPLVGDSQADAPACLERVEQLMAILEGLQKVQEGFCASARRFLRVPTVGSLGQLRAELQVRYSGTHFWVRPAGRKIDCMFISCHPGEAGHASGHSEEGSSVKEDVPLKERTASSGGETASSHTGPVVVWCNPNAAYYETMAYESHWLDFYLSQGCSIFLFNYSGFGRSQGTPTPTALAADGDAIIDFLRRRGFDNIGVHGRSIGGIAACQIASAHPDVVKFLVADRTFSTLAKAAKYTFGGWAAHGLSIAATWANNLQGYTRARCYKVMLVDPKDATIPDLAALRTAVATQALEEAAPTERLLLEDEQVTRLVEAWAFLDAALSICDREDGGGEGGGGCPNCQNCSKAKRPARQPVVGKPMPSDGDAEMQPVADEEGQRLVASFPATKRIMNVQWLEEHMEIVRVVMTPHADAIRVALDIVGSQLNAGGMSLDDALGLPPSEASYALRCFMTNLQVWGSLGPLRERHSSLLNKDIEFVLQKGCHFEEAPELEARLAKVADGMTPERLADYHRQLARQLVTAVRSGYRQSLSAVRSSMEAVREDGPVGIELRTAALNHLKELEALLTSIYRFFKCADLAGSGAAPPPVPGAAAASVSRGDSEEEQDDLPAMARTGGAGSRLRSLVPAAAAGPVLPKIDRQLTGYCVTIDCGHNGVLSEGESQHLARHIKAAGFGKYADDASPPQQALVGKKGGHNGLVIS